MLRFNGHEDLKAYLRGFINPNGGPVDYDFNGVVHLMLALLDNLRAHALEGELENIGGAFTEEQVAFFLKVAANLRGQETSPNDSVR